MGQSDKSGFGAKAGNEEKADKAGVQEVRLKEGEKTGIFEKHV